MHLHASQIPTPSSCHDPTEPRATRRHQLAVLNAGRVVRLLADADNHGDLLSAQPNEGGFSPLCLLQKNQHT